jgi:hypothetical protein
MLSMHRLMRPKLYRELYWDYKMSIDSQVYEDIILNLGRNVNSFKNN